MKQFDKMVKGMAQSMVGLLGLLVAFGMLGARRRRARKTALPR